MTPEQSIRATFDIFKPDGVIEVRAMPSKKIFSGYYRDRERLVHDLGRYSDMTWYFVMNDIDEACYSRDQSEKIMPVTGKMKTTSDKEIKFLKWVMIDADPVRAAGVSSTDEEKAKAKDTISRVGKYLQEQGFAEPVFCDSGNGYHLLYHVGLATAESETVKAFLQALDMLFSDDDVKIDTSVFNPARITKVYGTIATKGANTEERPHRFSRIIYVPEHIELTASSCLKKVAGIIPEPVKPTYRNSYRSMDSFDLDKFVRENGIPIARESAANGIRKLVLEHCPFNENHKAPDAALFVMPTGAIGFKCLHNSCQDKSWRDVRQLFDPHCYERTTEQPRTFTPKQSQKAPEPKNETREHFLRLQDIEVLDRSQIVSVPTGISGLDKKLIGMNKGELSIWSGGNGSGKSTMLSQLALEVVDRGFNVAMFSGELTSNRAKTWLHLQAAGKQYTRLSNDGVSYYVPKKESAMIDEWTADRLWIYNNQNGNKVYDVLGDFERHMERHKTDVIIIDNLMSLDLTEIKAEKYDRQTQLVLKLSEMAKTWNVHIHFVCHPRKPIGFLRKADISGTSDLTNAADNVFMMHRVNQDFMKNAGEYFGKTEADNYKDFSNVIEIMKNRDLGVSDQIVGVYFEPESKRMKNEREENRVFGWAADLMPKFTEIPEEEYGAADELPF